MKRLILPILLLLTHSALATTIHVPTQQPTIQAGIDAADSGDTVMVACGTYTWHGEGTGHGIWPDSDEIGRSASQ